MADYLIHDSTLEDIADAIRSKTGGSALINPENMAEEIASISGGGGYVPFTLSFASKYEGQSLYDAFMLLVNAVVATIGDKPFFAWLTTGNHSYEISYAYYIPQSITQQKASGLGWFGNVNRAESNDTAVHYFASTFSGFDPINTTASVNKMATSGRTVRIYTTDVYTVIDLSGVISVT